MGPTRSEINFNLQVSIATVCPRRRFVLPPLPAPPHNAIMSEHFSSDGQNAVCGAVLSHHCRGGRGEGVALLNVACIKVSIGFKHYWEQSEALFQF
jgi:hypothetical protein